jgi:hypothetical protein
MVRFTPDTWRDAIWRPIAMGAPDSGVYLEVMAPDIRFACLLGLTIIVVALAMAQRRKPLSRPTSLLLVFAWLAFVPWLATTGNGRYFLAVLVLAGPLCIALVHSMPGTPALRLALAALLVGLQGFVLVENDPRDSWELAPWGNKYLDLALTDEDRTKPAAYVLISNITYSLAAPQFDPRSSWIGLSSLPAQPQMSTDGRRAQSMLARARAQGLPIKLFVPTLPGHIDAQGQPDRQVREEMARLLGPHRLALEPAGTCGMRHSASLTGRRTPELAEQVGFWVCPLAYPADAPAPSRVEPQPSVAPELQARANRVFATLERECPRFFPPAESESIRLESGFQRVYSSDMKAYVMDDGAVWFKYWRALNANHVGTADEVLRPGFQMDCNNINGRSGLPWERKL